MDLSNNAPNASYAAIEIVKLFIPNGLIASMNDNKIPTLNADIYL